MNKRVLRHFGIESKGFFRDREYIQTIKDVCEEIGENALVAIAGPWGSGKTTLFQEVRRHLGGEGDKAPIFVRVSNEEKEKLRIGSILNALLYDLADEPPRQDLEARSRQVVRIIGRKVVSEKRKVVVYIENAHRLHVNTIRAIKDFRENEFAGVSPLFAVVLVGQDPLITKINQYGEVRCRCNMYELNESNRWFTLEKRVQFLEAVFGGALTDKARTRVASLYKTPLSMSYVVERKMEQAMLAGMSQIDETLLEMDLREYYHALNESDAVGYRELAARSGLALGTVSNVMTGIDRSKHNAEGVKAALEQIERERAQGLRARAVNQ